MPTLAAFLFLLACGSGGPPAEAAPSDRSVADGSDGAANQQVAIFAGGCFWCMEPPFDALDGVLSTTSGYIGGTVDDPTYEQVSSGSTGHAEAVKVVFDASRIGYRQLLDVFWRNVDPLVEDRQFCDVGRQYRPEIFYLDDEQRRLAEASRERLEASGRFGEPIAVAVTAASPFYPAEEYHQDYYEKNPLRYKLYRTGCGRDRRLQQLWGAEAGGH